MQVTPDSRAIPFFSTRCFPESRSSLYDIGHTMSVSDNVELFNRQDATRLKSRSTRVDCRCLSKEAHDAKQTLWPPYSITADSEALQV